MKKLFLFSIYLISIGHIVALEPQLRNLATSLHNLASDLSKPPVPLRDDAGLQDVHATPPSVPVRDADDDVSILPVPPRDDAGLMSDTGVTPPVPPRDIVLPPIKPHTGKAVTPPPPHILPAGLTHGAVPEPQEPHVPMPAPEPQPHAPATSTMDVSKPTEPTAHDASGITVQKKGETKKPELLAAETVEILVPKGDSITAAIGIDPKTQNLVVWGPELKTEPQLETFFGTGQFSFPSLESVASVAKPNNTLEVTYKIYPLIDMEAFRKQQKDFDELMQKTVAPLTVGINDAIKTSNLQGMLLAVQQNIPGAVNTIKNAFQTDSLRLETIYPKAFDKHVVSVDQVEQVIKNIQQDTQKVVDALVEEFGKLLDIKAERYKAYLSSQNRKPNEPVDYRLLAARWEKDRGYDSTRNNLKLFTDASPTLSARFAALQNWDTLSAADKKGLKTVLRDSLVEKSHIQAFEQLKDHLQAQKKNAVLQAVGNFYETAQNALKSVADKQAAADAQAAAHRAFIARMQAQVDALQRQQQSADQSAVAEKEWE